MTDKELQVLINDTIKAKNIHFSLLDKLEEEYERRFGYNPSQVDDNFFIDTFHYRQASQMTVKQMEDSARLHNKD